MRDLARFYLTTWREGAPIMIIPPALIFGAAMFAKGFGA